MIAPTAEAEPSRHPSVPEGPSRKPTAGVALASSSPTAIISAVTSDGATGVTLTGTIALLVVLAGLGGVGGWWRRRQATQTPGAQLKLSSLATVPVGKDATVALISAPGRQLLVGCSSAGVNLVSSDLDDQLSLSGASLSEHGASRTFRQMFANNLSGLDLPLTSGGSGDRGGLSIPDIALPASPEIQRLAAARTRVLGGHA